MPVPTLIIHGGAGAITRENLLPKAWSEYSGNLSRIYRSTAALLDKGVSALDAATHAVTLFEDCKLFNCGKGAVFTRDGTIELEASIMVTHPYRKRYCAAALLSHVKNPIKFVREMLIRGEHDGSGGGNAGDDGDPAGGSGGAQGHCCLSGDGAEKLAKEWGLEMVEPSYFWTRKRWEQHRKGLGKPTEQGCKGDKTQCLCASTTLENCPLHVGDSRHCHQTESSTSLEFPLESNGNFLGDDHHSDDDGEGWDGMEYLPQGTVGCVALDRDGAMCVATSTGGLTNKLAGRIGDTPTVGAGFWAEEWEWSPPADGLPKSIFPPVIDDIVSSIQRSFLADCIPLNEPFERYHQIRNEKKPTTAQLKAVALSGTGNGDSFLRLSACRTAGAIVRFSPPPPDGLLPVRTLASALNQIAGPGGELQQSAGSRWGKTGEGEAGVIGIECLDDGRGNVKGQVCFDFNCGGMFRCWIDAEGKERVMVFKDDY